ncbi:hypothetical protein MRX96_010720 [Rhipicephalus microplus]
MRGTAYATGLISLLLATRRPVHNQGRVNLDRGSQVQGQPGQGQPGQGQPGQGQPGQGQPGQGQPSQGQPVPPAGPLPPQGPSRW